jgi:flagellar basal body rod protein FlgB
MLYGIISRATSAGDLKEALNTSAQRTRVIADRVAKASMQFALPENGEAGAATQGEVIDLESEMVALADEQLRFEATARLLQKAYEQVRMSIRER